MINGPDRLLPSEYRTRLDFLSAIDLLLYMRHKLESFEEQPRTGIPRDEIRPLTQKKYSAEVEMLLWKSSRRRTLADIGRVVGCSDTQIRKWLTEGLFKQSIVQLRDEYLDTFFNIFLKDLNHFYAFIGVNGRKDNYTRDYEAMSLKRLTLLIRLADDRWGWIIQEEAHKRIQKVIDDLSHKQNPRVKEEEFARIRSEKLLNDLSDVPLRILNASGYAVDSRIAFLQLLDMVCFVRSKGKLDVDPRYLIRFQKSWEDVTARIHYDLCVAKERNRAETIEAYSEAQATLSALVARTLCRSLAWAAKGDKKMRKAVESWTMSEVYTPEGLELYTA